MTSQQSVRQDKQKTAYRHDSFQSLIDTYDLDKTWKNHPELLRDCEKIFKCYRKQSKPFNVLILELSDSLEMPAHLGTVWIGDRMCWHGSPIAISHLEHYYQWAYDMAQYTYRK